jgi:hypothetical protein
MEPAQERRKDPFETSELIERRWRQRLALRFLPDELVRQAARIQRRHMPEDHDRRIVEGYLRTRADETLHEQEVEEGIKGLAAARRARIVFEFATSTNPEVDAGGGIHATLRDFARDMEKRSLEGLEERDVDDDTYRKFGLAATLLVWADVMADDGYQDPVAVAAQRDSTEN